MSTPSTKLRVGVFQRESRPEDGGADTLLSGLRELGTVADDTSASWSPIAVPWSMWRYRRTGWRYWRNRWNPRVPLFDLRPVCRRLRLDVALLTAPVYAAIDTPYIYPLWDLGHRTLPDFPEMRTGVDSWERRESECRGMLPRASAVLVGNEIGRAEACEAYGLAANRVVALPFPTPDFSGVTARLPEWVPTGRWLFYPAQFWPHKNHRTLFAALAALRGDPATADLKLVLVGTDKGNETALRELARRFGLADAVIFGGFVPREELKGLYGAASALVFPSLLGPNNLPPQEAAALGCPMVISDLPGHREQMGDAAGYAEPLNPAAWRDEIRTVLNDTGLRDERCQRARERAAQYSFAAYAERLAEVIARVAQVRALWPTSSSGHDV